ncbi:MAG: hypothetical protein ACI8UZ_002903 [Akkermansiaceae bacterium]|jgi:hypothetical protein
MFLSADVGNSRDKQERDSPGAEPECFIRVSFFLAQ